MAVVVPYIFIGLASLVVVVVVASIIEGMVMDWRMDRHMTRRTEALEALRDTVDERQPPWHKK
jgi:hypothetical protein